MTDVNFDLVELKNSKIRGAGLGCFSTTLIPAGTLIGPYHGKYLTAKERNRVKNGVYMWKIHDDRFVDARHYPDNNPLRYVNGAKTKKQREKVNCIVKFIGATPEDEKIYYLTTRDIPRGEELIISYGNNYFIHE